MSGTFLTEGRNKFGPGGHCICSDLLRTQSVNLCQIVCIPKQFQCLKLFRNTNDLKLNRNISSFMTPAKHKVVITLYCPCQTHLKCYYNTSQTCGRNGMIRKIKIGIAIYGVPSSLINNLTYNILS